MMELYKVKNMSLHMLKQIPCPYLYPPLQKIVIDIMDANINETYW